MHLHDPLSVVATIRQIVLVAALFVPAELVFALYPHATFRRHRMADLILALFNGVVMRIPLMFLFLLATLAAASLPRGYIAAVAQQPFTLQVAEVALIGDFGIYVAHRGLHSRALWRFHAIHHSADHLDWLVSFKVHPLEMLLLEGASLLPAMLLGFPLGAIALFLLGYSWISLLNHANIRLRLGPLRRWLVGPEFHHWHHAREAEAHDRNFAALFAIWDRLFGTLFLPAGRQPKGFGIDDSVPTGFADQLAYPFRRVRRASDRQEQP